MAVVALLALRMNHLFAVVMLAGVFSLLSALLLVLMDAVDVAFTEAAVGAGVSTVLMIGTLALTTSKERVSSGNSSLSSFLIVFITGAVLIYGTLDMPIFGDPTAPIHHHVADHYLGKSQAEIGLPNVLVKSSKFFIGNQGIGYAIAEGLKPPRLLEGNPDFPVIFPIGENAYDFYHQIHFESFFEKLNN